MCPIKDQCHDEFRPNDRVDHVLIGIFSFGENETTGNMPAEGEEKWMFCKRTNSFFSSLIEPVNIDWILDTIFNRNGYYDEFIQDKMICREYKGAKFPMF